jgi:hypothetical protein
LANSGLRDSTTSPTEPPVSGWSSAKGGRVGAHLGHARPHVGIERQEALAHQQLAVGSGGRVTVSSRKQSAVTSPPGRFGEHDLDGFGHGSGLSTKSLRR